MIFNFFILRGFFDSRKNKLQDSGLNIECWYWNRQGIHWDFRNGEKLFDTLFSRWGINSTK